MTKRQREHPLQYEIKDDFVVLNYNGRQYTWVPPLRMILDKFLNEDTYDYSVVHTYDGKPMLNVESLRTNTEILRQEINPLKQKDSEKWEHTRTE